MNTERMFRLLRGLDENVYSCAYITFSHSFLTFVSSTSTLLPALSNFILSALYV